MLRYLHRQIFNILFCTQNLSTVSSDDVICISGVLFEYTFALKGKSTQKLTDLPEVKEKFSFPLLRKRTAGAQFDPSFQHQVLLMRWTKSIHCLDSLTNYSRCMSNLIFLPSVKAVMTNITCFLSKFVMFLKYTPFSRA